MSKTSTSAKGTQSKQIRLIVQIFFLSLIAVITIAHTLVEYDIKIPFVSTASVHAICPFGGIETAYQLMTTGDYIQKIHESSVVIFILIFILAVLFGPILCGWICPLGSVQEWIGKIGKKLFKKNYNQMIPTKIDHYLRYARYGFLVWILYMTYRSGQLLFSNLDPYYALFHFWTGEATILSIIVLLIVLALSLLIERPWCKYICPYGALLGITNLFRVFKIRRNKNTCIHCEACTNQCPMNITVSQSETVLNHQCISCLRCTSEIACPVNETVALSLSKKSLKHVKSLWIAIISFLVIFGGIAITSSIGYWNTENEQNQTKDTLISDPFEIRGSYTMEDVVVNFEIPDSVLIEAFNLPLDVDFSTFKSKDIESLFENSNVEIGNESLQYFVALYIQFPIEETQFNQIILPESALNALYEYYESNNLDVDILDKINRVQTKAEDPSVAITTEKNSGENSDEEASEINGNTTFFTLLEFGLTKADIESVLGMSMPAENVKVRDFCQENNLSFSEIKSKFGELINE